MLRIGHDDWLAIVAHAYDELPNEMCGLLVGPPRQPSAPGVDATAPAGEVAVVRFVPCRNAAASARVYTVDPRDHLRADRAAEEDGLEIIGVVHSHTHSPAHPSPTDVAAAVDPGWHYVIVSLADGVPSLRSWRIVEGNIDEEDVVVGKG